MPAKAASRSVKSPVKIPVEINTRTPVEVPVPSHRSAYIFRRFPPENLSPDSHEDSRQSFRRCPHRALRSLSGFLQEDPHQGSRRSPRQYPSSILFTKDPPRSRQNSINGASKVRKGPAVDQSSLPTGLRQSRRGSVHGASEFRQRSVWDPSKIRRESVKNPSKVFQRSVKDP